MILGTAAYMSPEQAKGRQLDRRSDIWAFGVVFYEMLTGQRAFKGEDVSETVALLLTREPDWASLPAETPPPIRRLLRRCLEKDRKQRLDSAADARLEIDEAMSAPSAVDGAAAQPGACDALGMVTRADVDVGCLDARARHRAGARAVGAVARGEAGGSAAGTAGRRPGRGCVIATPSTFGSSVAISPDGTRLAYASGTPTRLFVRRLDQPTATELPGTQGALRPVVFAGRAMGRFHRRHEAKQDFRGGRRRGHDRGRLRPHVSGAHWGEEGSLLVSESFGGGV